MILLLGLNLTLFCANRDKQFDYFFIFSIQITQFHIDYSIKFVSQKFSLNYHVNSILSLVNGGANMWHNIYKTKNKVQCKHYSPRIEMSWLGSLYEPKTGHVAGIVILYSKGDKEGIKISYFLCWICHNNCIQGLDIDNIEFNGSSVQRPYKDIA